jgi:transposase
MGMLRSRKENGMSYRIAGIDVHKQVLAVVIAEVGMEGEYEFERRKFGTTPTQLRELAAWLVEQQVEEAVMESTAQYWKPVWAALEQDWQPLRRFREGAGPMAGKLHLAQAQSNRGPRGRKNDFGDAERLVRRLVAQELRLSFVPEPEQRLWRSVSRKKLQLTQQRVRLHNQLESLLEEAHIKLSSRVSDLLGVSGRRILKAMAEGEGNPVVLASLADPNVKATRAQLSEALSASATMHAVYRRLLKMHLKELDLVEEQMRALDQELASLLQPHQETVRRLAEVPWLGVDSAHQIIAEVGVTAGAFACAKSMASWVGTCPGEEQSAQVVKSTRSPKGNRNLRRLLNQAGHAAVKTKGSVFEVTFQKLKRRMPYQPAIWAIAHRLCRLIWKILHDGVKYKELGPAVGAKAKQARTAKMIRHLRKLGYSVELPMLSAEVHPA